MGKWEEISAKFQKYIELGTFDGDQLTEIMEGLKDNVEIIIYAHTFYNADQMHEIRIGLGNNVNTKIYSDKKFSAGQMREIRLCLEDNLDTVEINAISNVIYSPSQMSVIRACFKDRLSLNDVRIIMNDKLSSEQMDALRIICLNGVLNSKTFKRIAVPEYTAKKMLRFEKYMKYDCDLSAYCDGSYTIEELDFFFYCFENKLQIEDIRALLSKSLTHERRRMIADAYFVMTDKFAIIGSNPEYSDDQVEAIFSILKEKYRILYEFKNIWTDDNEKELLDIMKKTKKNTSSKLYQLAKSTPTLELTEANPVKWNITRIRSYKMRLIKLFKELDKIYINK